MGSMSSMSVLMMVLLRMLPHQFVNSTGSARFQTKKRSWPSSKVCPSMIWQMFRFRRSLETMLTSLGHPTICKNWTCWNPRKNPKFRKRKLHQWLMKMVLRQLFVGRGDKHIELHCQLIFNIETRLKSIESKTARKHVYKTDRNLEKKSTNE